VQPGQTVEGESESLKQLESELRDTKRDLQSAVDELQGSNEDLRLANEEVISTTEELQSTNEELQTSREELQSVNEELTTVNSQLQDKVERLNSASRDIQNFLESTRIATLFLDGELRIKMFTPATTRLIYLIHSDLGRPIGDLSVKFVEYDLLADAQSVAREGSVIEREIRHASGSSYLVRVMPYQSTANQVEGFASTERDITERKRKERELKALNESLEQRVSLRTEQLRRLASELTLSEHRERQRLAMVLHDGLQQILVGAKYQIALAKHNQDLQGTTAKIGELIDEAIETSLSLTAQLSPPVLHQGGLVA
jgi:PAS domain S-box-containing protein